MDKVLALIIVFLPICTASDIPFEFLYGDYQDHYLGCFYIYPGAADILHKYSSRAMTIELCLTRCAERGTPLAGLTEGDTCHCFSFVDTVYMSYSTVCYESSAETCSGHHLQICGDTGYAYSLYCVSATRCQDFFSEVDVRGGCNFCSKCEERYDQCTGPCDSSNRFGPYCKTGCPPHYRGAQCEFWCGGCTDGKCDDSTGVCLQGCKQHFHGDNCNDCEECWLGAYCDKKPWITNCDTYDRFACSVCEDGYQGFTCTLPCPTNCVANKCHINGTCHSCPDGYFGEDCMSLCPPLCQNRNCDFVDGTCTECMRGFFGSTCHEPCPANCHNRHCDMTNGNCLQCSERFYGEDCTKHCPQSCTSRNCGFVDGTCTECARGFYGSTCHELCPANCLNRLCDMADGNCLQCSKGFFGEDCTKHCPQFCTSRNCDFVDGRCSECVPGFYGAECNKHCPVHCADGICQQDNGACVTCPPNRVGGTCDEEVTTTIPAAEETPMSSSALEEKLTAVYAVSGVLGVLVLGMILLIGVCFIRKARRQGGSTHADQPITDVVIYENIGMQNVNPPQLTERSSGTSTDQPTHGPMQTAQSNPEYGSIILPMKSTPASQPATAPTPGVQGSRPAVSPKPPPRPLPEAPSAGDPAVYVNQEIKVDDNKYDSIDPQYVDTRRKVYARIEQPYEVVDSM